MELFAKLKTIVTKSYMLDVGRVLNTLLLAALLIFVDLEVLKSTRNIEKLERAPYHLRSSFSKSCWPLISNFT